MGRRRALAVIGLLAADGCFVTWVTPAELDEGAFRSVDPQAHLLSFRHVLSTLPPSDGVLERLGEVRARLRREGNLIPNVDPIIAASALYHDLTLATLNVRHFRRLPDLRHHELT